MGSLDHQSADPKIAARGRLRCRDLRRREVENQIPLNAFSTSTAAMETLPTHNNAKSILR
jgi:hypothetical protein